MYSTIACVLALLNLLHRSITSSILLHSTSCCSLASYFASLEGSVFSLYDMSERELRTDCVSSSLSPSDWVV